MDYKSIKQNAKNSLHDNWASTILIIFTLFSAVILFYLIDVVIYKILLNNEVLVIYDYSVFVYSPILLILNITRLIIGFMVLTPLLYGAIYWFMHCSRKERPLISEMFIYYSSCRLYFKALYLNFIITLKSIIFIAPVCICVYWQKTVMEFCLSRATENSLFIIVLICSFIFTICLVIAGIVFISRYVLSAYILAINTDLKCNQIIKLSVSFMRGNEGKLFKFIFSFIWWLPLLVFILPAFYFLPYYSFSYTGLMDSLLDRDQIFDYARIYEK